MYVITNTSCMIVCYCNFWKMTKLCEHVFFMAINGHGKKLKGQSALNFVRKGVPIVQEMKICEFQKKVCETF